MSVQNQLILLGILIVLYVIIRGIAETVFYRYEKRRFWVRPLSLVICVSVELFFFKILEVSSNWCEKIDQGYASGFEIFAMIVSGFALVGSGACIFSSILMFIMTLFAPYDDLPFAM